METIRFIQTDKLTDRIENVIEIWYGDICFGFKFVKKVCSKTEYRWYDRIWYRLICSLETIAKCEKKWGYGWMCADCGYEIYPEDGSLTIQQIENELIPEVIQFIIEQEGYDEFD